MISELQDIFPKFTEQKIWKILLTVKARYKKHGTIGISRLEAARFGTSERQMQNFINYLKQSQAIKKVRMATASNGFKCNVYSLAKWFVEGLEEVKDFVRNVFEYINPTEYVISRFPVKKEGGKLKFKVDGETYYIPTKGRFKNKIFSCTGGNNGKGELINPLLLGS